MNILDWEPIENPPLEAFKYGGQNGTGRFHISVESLDNEFLYGQRPKQFQLYASFDEENRILSVSNSEKLENSHLVTLKYPSARIGFYWFEPQPLTNLNNPSKIDLDLRITTFIESNARLPETDAARMSFISGKENIFLLKYPRIDWNDFDKYLRTGIWMNEGGASNLLSEVNAGSFVILHGPSISPDILQLRSVGFVTSNRSLEGQLVVHWFFDFGLESGNPDGHFPRNFERQGVRGDYPKGLEKVSAKDLSEIKQFITQRVNKDKFGQFLADHLSTGDNESATETSNEDQDEIDNELLNQEDTKNRRAFTSNMFNYRDKSVPPALGVVELAEDVSKILVNLKDQGNGNMFGIFGKWGRGKTYLIEKICSTDKVQTSFIKIDFHAWKYQSTPASWAYLYEAFAEKYFETRKKRGIRRWLIQSIRAIRLNIKKWGTRPIWFTLLSIFSFIGYTTYSELITSQINFLLGTTTVAILWKIYGSYAKRAKDLGSKYTNRKSFTEYLGVQAEIQKELETLVEHWVKVPSMESQKRHAKDSKRILLVVEDIDRCPEDKIIEIVDALRVLLDNPVIAQRVVIVAAIDERILKRAILWKYHKTLKIDQELNFSDSSVNSKIHTSSIVSEYMDKLFLAGVSLNSLMDYERIEIYENLVAGKVKLELTEEQKQEVLDNISIELEGFEIGSGNTTIYSSLKDGKQNTELTREKDETEHELEEVEHEKLRLIMSSLQEATPRQIRIFYYRYLLGKLILQRHLTSLSMDTLLDFAYLLKEFYNVNRSEIIYQKKTLLSQENDEIEFKRSWQLAKPVRDRATTQALFNTLETVIAY